MRKGPWFFAPPAGSDYGLRPSQGQSRCKIMALSSFYYNYKNVKQIILHSKIILSVSHILKTNKYLFFIETDCAHLPLEGKTESTILEQHTYTPFEIEQACSIFRNTLYTYLFRITTRLFFFSQHYIHIPILN